jgi:hypothetical protein
LRAVVLHWNASANVRKTTCDLVLAPPLRSTARSRALAGDLRRASAMTIQSGAVWTMCRMTPCEPAPTTSSAAIATAQHQISTRE